VLSCQMMEPGPFPDGRTRREFNKMLRDIDPEGYDPRILEQVPSSFPARCTSSFSLCTSSFSGRESIRKVPLMCVCSAWQ